MSLNGLALCRVSSTSSAPPCCTLTRSAASGAILEKTVGKDAQKTEIRPVRVIEAIPVAGDNRVDPNLVKTEMIPTPKHLCMFPELGRGGMGHVHPATDRNLLRHVALKRLDKEFAGVAFYRDGFIAEAQMTGQLEHPNIVPVHELSVDPQGVPYFTMKLVQGMDLHEWLHHPHHQPGTPDRIETGLEIFLKVCDALAYAHHRGVIHRDLKPENIMVASFGQVYLMDWGLARLSKSQPASGRNAQMNAPGAVGTADYMAPEQARGNPALMDERCDVFGLGAILYEIVSGLRPYGDLPGGAYGLEVVRAGRVVPIEQAARGLPVARRLLQIVERATAVNPDERYASVEELQSDVRAFLRGGLHLPRRAFAAGETIIREGDVGDAAYMIVSGRCRAVRNADGQVEELGIMGPGEVFGEMALLLDEPRAASVVAEEPVVVTVLDKSTMDEGLGVGGWTGALVVALAQRFRALEQQFRDSGMRRSVSSKPPG